jgi:hypothetical protein
MANRALANALQLALAGATGGFSGLVQARSREQREMEAQREQERQALRDTLAQQQFQLSQKEYEARYGPEAVARAERDRAAELKFKAEQAAADRAAELARARIAAGATAGVERMRQTQELQQSRLAGRAFLGQARKAGGGIGTELLGNVIASEVVRRGRQLTQDEIDDLSAAVLGQIAGERKMVATELAAGGEPGSGFAPMAPAGAGGGAALGGSPAQRMQGGSYLATAGGQAGAAKPTREQRARDLISQGKSQAEIERIMRAEGYTFND